MARMKIARLLAIASFVVLALPGTASAETPDQVAQALRDSPVYQSSGLDLVDVAVLRSELQGSNPPLYAAILPGAAASTGQQAETRATEILQKLGNNDAVVLVITANQKLGAAGGPGARAQGIEVRAALKAEIAGIQGKPFTKDTVGAFVLSFKERLVLQASAASGQGAGSSSSTPGGGGGVGGGAGLLGGLALLGGGAVAIALVSSKRRKAKVNSGLRADVEQLYNRLGSDVSSLAPGDNPVARQALADASERYNATGAALATADSEPTFAAARRTAVEGLTAARVVRKELGLDPGPDIPPPPATGPQLQRDEQVALGDQVYDGSPNYQPGRQHYYGGGRVGGQNVHGGWYSAPFWEPFLLGSLLTGGLGGGLFGGGGGYERGYEQGQDNASDNGGGDWGGGGGGGGDWGGGGGGGDSGGGSW